MHDQAQNSSDMTKKDATATVGTKVITVTSGKGGVGKSSVTVALAITIAQRGLRVLIIDADFGFANIDVMLGVTATYDLSHVINGGVDIMDIVLDGHHGVKFISGGSGVFDLMNIGDEQLHSIVTSLLKLEDVADVIIFDTGAGVNENILQLVQSSTETIIVTTPEPTAAMNAYAMMKTIDQLPEKPPIKLIINKAENVKEARHVTQSLIDVSSKYLKLDISDLGYILYDPVVGRSVKAQEPFVVAYPKSTAAVNVRTIVSTLIDAPGTVALADERRGFSRFLRKFLFPYG